MVTAGSKKSICSIVVDRTLELETEAGRKPVYTGLVKMEDILVTVEWSKWNGDRNESNIEVYNGHDGKLITSHRLDDFPTDVCLISKNEVAVCVFNNTIVILSLKSIDDVKLVKTLQTGFDTYQSLAKWNSDKLIVSGWKEGMMLCWGILSIRDGRMDSTHYICEGYGQTHIAVKDNTVYISCRTDDSIANDGVYVYDILNPKTKKFLYQHQELTPWSIMADRDYVYVCDSNRIHQLTDSGQLVTIHTVSSRLDGIFYDDQHRLLYTTSYGSNVITVYKMESLHQPGIPVEILNMDDRSIQLFENALKDGKEKVYSIRVMVVGHQGVGKTTLIKRLLGKDVNISERQSTEGIDVHLHCCDVSLSSHEWTLRKKELVDVWMNSVHSCAPPDNEIMNFKVIPPPVILVGTHADAIQQAGKEEQMTLVPDAASKPAHSKMQPKLVKLFRRIFTKKGAEASKVKSQMEAGAKKELDETQTKDYRHEICENYFREIRSHLKDKPSRFHLVEEEFDIDNTIVDSKLEGLKRKIVEVASQQPYWGEEIPAKWLPLEQVLMNLRAQGHKVIHRSLLENINQAGGLQVTTDELDLFLRFQHEIGTILYFSTELLKEKIVLEPQWMINALKSLITAEMFVLRYAPSVSTMWDEFRNGKLYPELIDAVWTKDADLHDNKDHILLLMEQLNIIAKPKLYIDDESEIKEVNYFFAPCMLHAKPPREVIFPEHHEQMESSSVMCYVFTGKFLPAPIFHRLLAACVAQWPLATKKMKTTLDSQIFCGCGVFQIDDYHKLTLHFLGYIIFMRVTRQGIKDKTPSSKMCIKVKEFIAKVLNNLIGYLGHSLKFEEFIQCPDYNDESVNINSLFQVTKLKENAEVRCDLHDNIIESNKILKFWFDGEEQSGDSDASSAGPMPSAPISDKDRFMCIAYLLNDVGSKVLRQLFHEMVTPTCTLDQYLANNRSKIDSLLKKKVLNVSQMDIMFPPNGDPTNLTDYDITLLSALFNNIMPSLGQQEKNLIKSLRDNRNKLYGHTKSCKMNVSDFHTCWSDISSTLITLSQQCVDTKFKNEISMEIQHTQVPDASYLSMIHTLYSRIERLESNKTSTSET